MMSNPALFDQSIEFLENVGQMFFVQSGKNLPLREISGLHKEILVKAMNDHPYSAEAFEYWKITEIDDQLEKFTMCRYGLGNSTADIDANGDLSPAEFKYCSEREKCRMDGKFCAGVDLVSGRLTKREVEITSLIGLGLADKVICSDLHISQETLRSHKNHIEEKAGIKGKIQIARIAFEFRL